MSSHQPQFLRAERFALRMRNSKMAAETKSRRSKKSKSHRKGSDRRWSGNVKTVSTYPPEGLYTKDAETIARVMATKKVSPKGIGSAIRMVQFYINRAGKSLSPTRRRELERSKVLLREKRKAKD
jgi:tRNA(adenine34) deaminase